MTVSKKFFRTDYFNNFAVGGPGRQILANCGAKCASNDDVEKKVGRPPVNVNVCLHFLNFLQTNG